MELPLLLIMEKRGFSWIGMLCDFAIEGLILMCLVDIVGRK